MRLVKGIENAQHPDSIRLGLSSRLFCRLVQLNPIHPLVLQTGAVFRTVVAATVDFAQDSLVQLVGVVVQLLSLFLTVQLPLLLLLQAKWRVCEKVFKDPFQQQGGPELHVGKIGEDDDRARLDREAIAGLEEEDQFCGVEKV